MQLWREACITLNFPSVLVVHAYKAHTAEAAQLIALYNLAVNFSICINAPLNFHQPANKVTQPMWIVEASDHSGTGKKCALPLYY